MAVIEFRDDNSFVLFIDSEGWDQSIRKENVSLRINNENKTLGVYDGNHKWFDISPAKVQFPPCDNVEDLRTKLEDILDDGQILTKRSPFTTLFGRLQISTEEFIFENRFEYDEEPRFWDIVENVNGSVVFNQDDDSVGLNIGTAAGDKLIRQTREYFRYTAGKLQRAKFGIITNEPKAGLRQRFGMFDAENGFFFEFDGTDVYIVRRSNASGSVIEERILQSDWNEDVFDGRGKSREALDFNFIQMVVIEYSWYGAGGANFGFVIEGELFYAHHIDAGDRLNEPILGRPLLPLRYEIENLEETADASQQRLYGATVSDDGGRKQVRGRIFIAEQRNAVSVDQTGFIPVLTVRPKLTVNGIDNRTSLEIVSIELTSSIDLCEFRVIHDGVLTGASFVDEARFVEKDVSSTAVTFEQDDVVGGGFVSGGNQSFSINSETVTVRFPFTINFDATEANQVTVAMRAVSQNSGNVRAIIKGLTEF